MSGSYRIIAYLPNGEEREFEGECSEEIVSIIEHLAVDDWPDAMVLKGEADDSGWIHIFYLREFGWLIVCCGQSDAIEHYLIGNESAERIVIRKAGQKEEYRRSQFVSRALAFSAISVFLRTGERDKRLKWIPIGT